MVIIISIVIILLSLILYMILYDYYVHRKRSGQLIDLIPGLPHIPIFGSIHVFHRSRKNMWHVIRYFSDAIYPVVKCWFGSVPVVSIRHPDDLETVLNGTKHIEKGRMYDLFRPFFNEGLLTSGGNKWRTRRKMLTPAFHFDILRQFGDILFEESNRMIKSLKDVEEPILKDLLPFLREHTLNIICETAMGTCLHNSHFKERYRLSLQKLHEFGVYRLISPWLYPDFMYAMLLSRKVTKLLKITHGFSEQIIMKRKLYHESTDYRYLKNIGSNRSTETDNVEEIGKRKKRLALLDLLIATSQENHMTDLDIREEVDTFISAGHETTAIGVCFTLLLLAEHKDIQDRLRTEIDGVTKENEGKLTMTSLQKLPYLERCLKEALRLYPPVHSILRLLSGDIKCQSYTVPANTIMHLNIYDVHRDPIFWPNPDVFDPDRFLPEQAQNRHPYSYIPFSAGPRNCIGQRFALLKMKVIVASLVHNFYLEPVDNLKDVQIEFDIILRPAHSIRIQFIPIK